MERLSVGQKRALSEFFVNAAVAWLSIGVITPFFASRKLEDFVAFGAWGLVFSLIFITISLFFAKGVSV